MTCDSGLGYGPIGLDENRKCACLGAVNLPFQILGPPTFLLNELYSIVDVLRNQKDLYPHGFFSIQFSPVRATFSRT